MLGMWDQGGLSWSWLPWATVLRAPRQIRGRTEVLAFVTCLGSSYAGSLFTGASKTARVGDITDIKEVLDIL